MTSNDFDIIEKAFQKALELDPNAREIFVEEFSKKHPNLITKLENLLEADANEADPFAEVVSSSIRNLADASNDPWIDREIRVWKIKERIGAGGMGAVFLADRIDEQYAQKVAIKILSSQLLDKNAAIRFRTERQILANLNHPNIATLIDGGVTDTDLPFLVMEYIDGVRIDEYCDGNNLSIADRIELFKTVCDAVDYAHRNLVVHCDLKPSNILVTKSGTVKLLDFGIAKLIEPEEFDMTIALTAAGARVMTPEYASPEQVRGEPVSTSTDVYALGVLLFRLLTGRSPYGNEFTTAHEIQSAILETDPKRPSTIVTEAPTASILNTPSSPDELSNLRGTSIDRLRKKLAGDLDTIILKCLQKDAERRYPSPREISADLTRFVRNEPILARSDSWRYKTGKFIRRNTRAVMASAAVVAMTVSLVSFYTFQLSDERDKAQLAAAEANQVSEFLQDIFRSADPHTAKGTPATAVDLLESAELKISILNDQPYLQAELMQIIGDTYTNLGKNNTAIKLLEKSLAVRKEKLLEKPLELAEIYHDLAEAYRTIDDPTTAEPLMRIALTERLKVLPPGDELIVRTRARLAVILSEMRQRRMAKDLLKQALDDKLALTPEHDELSVDIMGNMANSIVYVGDYQEAQNVHEETVKLSNKISGPLHPNTVIRTANLARLYIGQFRFLEADAKLNTAISAAKQVWPEHYPIKVSTMALHATTLGNLGRFDEAVALHQQTIKSAETNPGRQSTHFIALNEQFAATLIKLGKFEDAKERLIAAERSASDIGVLDSYTIRLVRLRQAQLYNLQNRPETAIKHLDMVWTGKRDISAKLKAIVRTERAISLSLLGQYKNSRQLLQQNLAEYGTQLGDAPGPLLPILIAASMNERRTEQLPAALSYARRANEIGQKHLPTGNWMTALAASELAQTLAAQGKPGEAKEIAEPAHKKLLETFGPNDYRVREIRSLLN